MSDDKWIHYRDQIFPASCGLYDGAHSSVGFSPTVRIASMVGKNLKNASANAATTIATGT